MSKLDSESTVRRNSHPDFKKVEASRPPFDQTRRFHYTQTVQPDWKLGDGANFLNSSHNGGTAVEVRASGPTNDSAFLRHVEIDPYAPGRPAVSNYKLLISAIVPRPIGFVSTCSADGSSTNLAPFSYTQVIAGPLTDRSDIH